MREIKFRGKSVVSGEWVCGSLVKTNDHAWIFIPEESAQNTEGMRNVAALPIIPETVGQYTGLKDKNGKEIHEGDIIEYTAQEKIYREPVIYDDYMFDISGFYSSLFDYPTVAFSEGTGSMKVIGNIHDNPELLEVQK